MKPDWLQIFLKNGTYMGCPGSTYNLCKILFWFKLSSWFELKKSVFLFKSYKWCSKYLCAKPFWILQALLSILRSSNLQANNISTNWYQSSIVVSFALTVQEVSAFDCCYFSISCPHDTRFHISNIFFRKKLKLALLTFKLAKMLSYLLGYVIHLAHNLFVNSHIHYVLVVCNQVFDSFICFFNLIQRIQINKAKDCWSSTSRQQLLLKCGCVVHSLKSCASDCLSPLW